jgi:hypothetical protein
VNEGLTVAVKKTKAAYWATITAFYWVVSSTIVGEMWRYVDPATGDKIRPLRDFWLVPWFSHHWIGKGIIGTLLFLAVYCLWSTLGSEETDTELPTMYPKKLGIHFFFLGLVLFFYFIFHMNHIWLF